MEIYIIIDANGRFAEFTTKLNRFAKLGYRVVTSDLSNCRALMELKQERLEAELC